MPHLRRRALYLGAECLHADLNVTIRDGGGRGSQVSLHAINTREISDFYGPPHDVGPFWRKAFISVRVLSP